MLPQWVGTGHSPSQGAEAGNTTTGGCVHRERTKACFASLWGTLRGSRNPFRARAISLHNAHHAGCHAQAPGTWQKDSQQWWGSPVVKRCLVGWSGGLFMPPGAAGEDWVRPRAWWGTVDRLRGAWYTCSGCSCWVSENTWEGGRWEGAWVRLSLKREDRCPGASRGAQSSPSKPPPSPTSCLQGQETLQPSLSPTQRRWGGMGGQR